MTKAEAIRAGWSFTRGGSVNPSSGTVVERLHAHRVWAGRSIQVSGADLATLLLRISSTEQTLERNRGRRTGPVQVISGRAARR